MTPRNKKTPEAPSYTEAVKELEQILGTIEGSDVDLDRLAGRVERASELVKLLKARIKATEMKVARVVEDLREASEKEEAGPGMNQGDEPPPEEPPPEEDLFNGENRGDPGPPDEQVPF